MRASLASIAFVLSALIVNASSAADDVEVLASGTAHEALFSVAICGDKGFAVGAGGDVRESSDAGNTWAQKPQADKSTLLGVACNGERALAVGLKGAVVVRGADGNWKAFASGSDSRLLAVGVNASGVAVAVGAFGALLRSEDGGQTWNAAAPTWTDLTQDGVEPNLYGVHVDDDGAVTVVGEFGTIIRFANATWESKHTGEATLFGIDIDQEGVGYAVGQDGLVMRTADHGQSWSDVQIGTKVNLLSVELTANGSVYATGMHEILKSQGDGQPWQALALGASSGRWHVSLAATEGPQHVIAVGQAGQILKLRN